MTTINVEERVERAREYFAQGYNCAQAVVLAFADIAELDEQLAATIAAPFGGGLARLKEVCGTVSGMSIIGGFATASDTPAENSSKMQTYSYVQDMVEDFRSENGSIVCRELLKLRAEGGEAVKNRSCADLVAHAARIVALKLSNS